MASASKTADVSYLRKQQYADGHKLAARAGLHKYGRGGWFALLSSLVRWTDAKSVIDIGCGPGAFWTAAANAVPPALAITLVDLSSGMVEAAVARTRSIKRWTQVEGQVADAAALPFPDGTFDVALCNHVLYHLPEPARGVAEVRRVLRPGGTALVATNGLDNLAELSVIRRRVFGVDPVDPGAAAFGLETAEPVLKAAFRHVELIRFPDELRCTEPADVVAHLLSMPPGDGASEEDAARLRAAVAEVFDAAGGVLTVRKNMGVFRCRA